MSAPDPLPRPTVSSEGTYEGGVHKINVTASRDGKSRSWIGVGTTPQAAGRDLVEKVLNDPHSAEYVKRG